MWDLGPMDGAGTVGSNPPHDPDPDGPVPCRGLFLGVLVFLEVGRRIGRRRIASGDTEGSGFGAVEGAVFGLIGLLIAFTFSGAAGALRRPPAPGHARKPTPSARPGCGSTCCPRRPSRRCATCSGATWTPGSRPTAEARDIEVAMAEFDALGGAPAGHLDRGGGRLPGPGGGAGRVRAGAARAQRDDRHHDHEADGDAHAPAARHLRRCSSRDAGQRAPGRLRHGQQPRGAGCTSWPSPP